MLDKKTNWSITIQTSKYKEICVALKVLGIVAIQQFSNDENSVVMAKLGAEDLDKIINLNGVVSANYDKALSKRKNKNAKRI